MSHKIQIKFDDKQEHQIHAVESTINLFDGMPKIETDFKLGGDIVPNLPEFTSLEENWLLGNLNAVREKNEMDPKLTLDMDDGLELEDVSLDSWRYPHFTLEMETGTGKTYVYLRTIHELKQRYGFRKFIVVVPSIAIYEGVIKNFAITLNHFKTLFGNDPIHLTQYDGQQLSKLRNFANSSFTEIMVITIDSFNKKSNIIYKPSEKLQGEFKPYEYIQATRPILILDEPQNMESEKAKSALRTLHPLFALRYSATHRTSPNLFYRLSPVDAFRRGLVKRIQVYGVQEEFSYGQTQLVLEKITGYGPKAKVRTLVNKRGETKMETIEIKKGDDLFEKTKLEVYRDNGFVVDEINRKDGVVIFLNQHQISFKETSETSKPEIFKKQIEETITRHFQTQDHLKEKGIKVLSLFFIDRVANYIDDDGIIRNLFDASFKKIRKRFDSFKHLRPEEVRSAYFAIMKTKKGEEFIDTEGKNDKERQAEKEAFKLIMRDKERLLSYDEKVSFVFAHSALKEGWDNPNVFQICTLNQTQSEMKKRQEIGRGLRLCVNQNGERVMDEDVNILTVIANESYESYVRNLQIEYTEDGEIAPPQPTNATRKSAKRNDRVFRSRDFTDFWKKLSQQTRYEINIDTDQLIQDCINGVKAAQFPEPQIVISKGKFVITTYNIELKSVSGKSSKIKVTISDTQGNEGVVDRTFFEKQDFMKLFKDERLKDFKIVQITDAGDDSEVVFGNGRRLKKYQPIILESQIGQKIDSTRSEGSESHFPVFNFVDRVARETGLTRPTIVKIFKGLPTAKKELIFKNPENFTNTFLAKIRDILADHIADRIEYVVDEGFEDYNLKEIFPKERRLLQKRIIEGDEKALYDQLQIDSEIEENFVIHRLQKEDEVVLYFKFPNTFRIGIPKVIGNYNPDWGIIRWSKERKAKLELVRETKGGLDPNLLQYSHEKRKIACAEKHFEALGIDYRHITGDEINWWIKRGS